MGQAQDCHNSFVVRDNLKLIIWFAVISVAVVAVHCKYSINGWSENVVK